MAAGDVLGDCSPSRTLRWKMGSLAARRTREAYVARVRGSNHHATPAARSVTNIPTPITSTTTLIGRSAAARSILLRSSDERGEAPLLAGGPDLGLW
jgi:hypothetical protein